MDYDDFINGILDYYIESLESIILTQLSKYDRIIIVDENKQSCILKIKDKLKYCRIIEIGGELEKIKSDNEYNIKNKNILFMNNILCHSIYQDKPIKTNVILREFDRRVNSILFDVLETKKLDVNIYKKFKDEFYYHSTKYDTTIIYGDFIINFIFEHNEAESLDKISIVNNLLEIIQDEITKDINGLRESNLFSIQ